MSIEFPLYIVFLKHLLFYFVLQLKKIFAQVIIAMAHHGYLELEGGHQMIEFIVKQCSLPNDPPVSSRFTSPDPGVLTSKNLPIFDCRQELY